MRKNSHKSALNAKSSSILPRGALPSIPSTTHRSDAYRSLRSAGGERYVHHQKSSNVNVCVQEIQLNNSKWLVFNEQKMDCEDFWNHCQAMSFGLLRKNGKFGKKQRKKMENVSVKENLRILTEIHHPRSPIKKTERSPIKNEQIVKSPLKSSLLKSSRKASLTHEEQQITSRDRNQGGNDSKFKYSRISNKSNKSKSGKNGQKGSRMRNGERIEQVNKNHGKSGNAIANEVKDEERLGDCLEKRVLLAQIYDDIELLNPVIFKHFTYQDCFYDYSDLTTTKNVIISAPPQQNPIKQSLPSQQNHDQNHPNPSVICLPPEIQVCQQITISKLLDTDTERLKKQETKPQIIETSDLGNKNEEKVKYSCQPLELKEFQQQKSSNKMDQQVLPNKKQPIEAPIQEQPVSQQSSKHESYDQFSQFSSFKQIRLIWIQPNAQTALLPSKLSSHYLSPIPSSSVLHQHFSNPQLLSFLNHLIFSQPQLLHSMFPPPTQSKVFNCLLYANGQRRHLTVDGLFAFDLNYYPLYGVYDQFIWFSVMTKSIAKMMGSYAVINTLDFREIYQLITGKILLTYDVMLNEFRALRDIKTMMRNSDHGKNGTLFVRKEQNYYKIMKIQSKALPPTLKEFYKNHHQHTAKSFSRDLSQDNFKSLNQFLKKQIKVCQKNDIHENTVIYLKGYNHRRKMTFKEFVSEGFQVYLSQNIQLKSSGKFDGLFEQ